MFFSCHCCSSRSGCSLSGTAAGNSRAHFGATDCCRDLDVSAACLSPVRAALARLDGLQILASTFPAAEGTDEGAGARTDHPDARSSRSVALGPLCGMHRPGPAAIGPHSALLDVALPFALLGGDERVRPSSRSEARQSTVDG